MKDKSERIFITWTPFSSRSHLLAQAFNAKPYYIGYLRKKTFIHTFLRYLLASFHTAFILHRSKPKFIFLVNQPVFLSIIVYCYSKIIKCHYIIDSHSGLFNREIWRKFIPIMKKIYDQCLVNIAHNEYDAAIYCSWGVRTVILGTEVYSYDCYKKTSLKTKNNIVVIGKYACDEPTDKIVLAAKGIDNVYFYITGSIEMARKKIDIKNLAKNITLTDFLPRDEFVALVKAADAALVLVTTDNTMQRAAWEALSCGTPLILSDWPVLRSTFPKGAIFVKNTEEGIKDGIVTFFEQKEILKEEAIQLIKEKRALWNREVSRIADILQIFA